MTSLGTLYKGSVKDLLGPARAGDQEALVFEYTDAYSVFDWGRMPDGLARKGEALAVLAAHFFERLESPEAWKEFSCSRTALALRKGNRFGGAFNEIGEELQSRGLRTHYLGVLGTAPGSKELAPERLSVGGKAPRRVVVRQVSVVRPETAMILGRALPDYLPTRRSPPPRLVPLEVVFRFSCPEGSSLFERVACDKDYLASIGFPEAKIEAGKSWDFPILEVFTKLESTDRHLSLGEALAISGLSGAQFQKLLLKTAWVAGFLRSAFAQAGLELADGKLEWGLDRDGESFLVDAIGPDELRISMNGVQLSKEFLRIHYRNTPWYDALARAKGQAKAQGTTEWKRFVAEGPQPLPAETRELGSQLYLALANELTGARWFPEAWPLSKVAAQVAEEVRS